ncbi:nitroreductase family protein [Caldifermentibacillus hisashii]
MIINDAKNYRKPEHEIDDVFINRWSPRSFSEQEVPEDILLSIFEAARWAPSAFNEQPWRFIIARTKEAREKFYSFISEFNLTWCKKAPVLVLILSKKNSERGENKSHAFDTGAAWGFLALQATKCGLVTHPMTGFHFEKAREVLGIPDDYAIQALVAIGYQGEREDLPSNLQEQEQPKGRRPLGETIFEDIFGITWK